MRQFSAGPINKTLSNYKERSREYMKAGGAHFEHLLQFKNVHTCGVSTALSFDNVKAAIG